MLSVHSIFDRPLETGSCLSNSVDIKLCSTKLQCRKELTSLYGNSHYQGHSFNKHKGPFVRLKRPNTEKKGALVCSHLSLPKGWMAECVEAPKIEYVEDPSVGVSVR